MTRLCCPGCQDGRHGRHRGYVPAGMILAPCRCLDCDSQPIQARLFCHALVETTVGPCVDCGQPAMTLLVGGAGHTQTSSCSCADSPQDRTHHLPADSPSVRKRCNHPLRPPG